MDPSVTNVSRFTLDPSRPGQTIRRIDRMACAAHTSPCGQRAFIGACLGLAISGHTVYRRAVLTDCPSGVIGGGGARVCCQQPVLETVARAALGIQE